MNNPGSFGAAIGGGDAIQQAMQRRGMGVGVTQQVSPASPNFDQSAAPVSGAGQSPMPAVPQGSPPSTGSQGLPAGSFEADTIIKALDSRLKTLSKIDEAKNIPQKLGGI